MKKTLICSLLAIASASFASQAKDTTESFVSGSSIKAPNEINALPVNKEIDEYAIQKVDQAKELVGSAPHTWTPAYLKVESYKNCLDEHNYRGWQGLCMPAEQPKECPDNSWSKLQEMNLVPCSKDDD